MPFICREGFQSSTEKKNKLVDVAVPTVQIQNSTQLHYLGSSLTADASHPFQSGDCISRQVSLKDEITDYSSGKSSPSSSDISITVILMDQEPKLDEIKFAFERQHFFATAKAVKKDNLNYIPAESSDKQGSTFSSKLSVNDTSQSQNDEYSLLPCCKNRPDTLTRSLKARSHSKTPYLPITVESADQKNDVKNIPQKNGMNETTAVHSAEDDLMLSSGLEISSGISLATEIGSFNTPSDLDYKTEEKEKIRAIQGNDPVLEHFDFSGSRMPPPCDWEIDRPKFDKSFINSYIIEWRQRVPKSDPTGFEKNEKWLSGKLHVKDNRSTYPPFSKNSNSTFHETDAPKDNSAPQTTNEVTLHEITNHENRSARPKNFKNQFRAHSPKTLPKIQSKNQPKTQSKTHPKNHPKIQPKTAQTVSYDNPFSPKIQMYLRPAVIEDSTQIAQIYNEYIAKANITEDQEPISVEDAIHLIENNKREKLPFIVAVAGQTPSLANVQSQKTKRRYNFNPRSEKILGFAFNERFNYSFSGSTKGRSRYTTTLQLFVAYDYQDNGIGRNLLDRLIHMLSTAYGYKKACDFINPNGDHVHECEGSGMWHQIQFHVPVLKRDDPDFSRIKNFLFSKFLIRDVCRMKSTGRTNVNRGPAKWLDTVIFQFETSQEGNFDPYS